MTQSLTKLKGMLFAYPLYVLDNLRFHHARIIPSVSLDRAVGTHR